MCASTSIHNTCGRLSCVMSEACMNGMTLQGFAGARDPGKTCRPERWLLATLLAAQMSLQLYEEAVHIQRHMQMQSHLLRDGAPP